MKKFLIGIGLFLTLFNCQAQDTTQQVVKGRKNDPSQYNKPYIILISADGFRYDYIDKYNAVNLKRLSSSGVRAASMIPSFPSVTFPNHYTIATGMYPSHHGLVYNQYFDQKRGETYNMADRKAVEDGTWYGGVPIWVLAEQHKMLSASYHFVGTEAPIQGILPTYWYKFKDGIDIDRRINTVVNWLKLPADQRPHMISFYMSNTDHNGHEYGPETPQTKEAVAFVDGAIGKLQEAIAPLGLPVNFIFVADHGMTTVDTTYRMDATPYIDTAKFIWKGGGTSLHIYAKKGKGGNIDSLVRNLRANGKEWDVYLKDSIPARWNYSVLDDKFGHIGDVFVVPHFPKVMSMANRRISPGAHGFDPAIKEMHASFYAWGPAFKSGLQIPSFENIHIYPLIAQILGLTYSHTIDGNLEVLRTILKD